MVLRWLVSPQFRSRDAVARVVSQFPPRSSVPSHGPALTPSAEMKESVCLPKCHRSQWGEEDMCCSRGKVAAASSQGYTVLTSVEVSRCGVDFNGESELWHTLNHISQAQRHRDSLVIRILRPLCVCQTSDWTVLMHKPNLKRDAGKRNRKWSDSLIEWISNSFAQNVYNIHRCEDCYPALE